MQENNGDFRRRLLRMLHRYIRSSEKERHKLTQDIAALVTQQRLDQTQEILTEWLGEQRGKRLGRQILHIRYLALLPQALSETLEPDSAEQIEFSDLLVRWPALAADFDRLRGVQQSLYASWLENEPIVARQQFELSFVERENGVRHSAISADLILANMPDCTLQIKRGMNALTFGLSLHYF